METSLDLKQTNDQRVERERRIEEWKDGWMWKE